METSKDYDALRIVKSGGRGIRTPGGVTPTTVFKTAGFNHSPIPPLMRIYQNRSIPSAMPMPPLMHSVASP
jgi:hypothetical protein